jgi:hypothetical protein
MFRSVIKRALFKLVPFVLGIVIGAVDSFWVDRRAQAPAGLLR